MVFVIERNKENSTHKLLEHLENYGFGPSIKSLSNLETAVKKSSFDSLLNLRNELSDAVSKDIVQSNTPFTFVGTKQFSGSPNPCVSTSCRLMPAEDLARFSALYADHVYLPNPIRPLYDISDAETQEDHFRHEILICIAIILIFKPLIINNLVSFVEPDNGSLCPDCFRESWCNVMEKERLKADDNFISYLVSRFKKEVKFFVSNVSENGEVEIHVTASEDIIPCQSLFIMGHQLSDFKKKGEFKTIPAKLNSKQIAENGLPYSFILEIIEDIQTQINLSNRFKASYLTNRKIDYDILNEFGGEKRRTKPATSPSLFSHMLPTVDKVSLDRIVRLRIREGESFQFYREAMAKALESVKEGNELKEQQIFDDLVRPEIIKLDNTIWKSRKILFKSASKDFVMALGALTIGGITAALPHELRPLEAMGGMCSGGGLVHYSKRFLQAMVELKQEPDEAINHQFYFLWKLSKKAG